MFSWNIFLHVEGRYKKENDNFFWIDLCESTKSVLLSGTRNKNKLGLLSVYSRLCKRRGTLFILWLSWEALEVLSPWCLAGCTSMKNKSQNILNKIPLLLQILDLIRISLLVFCIKCFLEKACLTSMFAIHQHDVMICDLLRKLPV